RLPRIRIDARDPVPGDRGNEVRDRRQSDRPVLGDPRRHRCGRRARTIRRRMGPHPRIEHGARARRPLRSPDRGGPGHAPVHDGELARQSDARHFAMRTYRGVVIGLIALGLLIVLAGGSAIAGFVAELYWYRSLSLDDVFWTHWRGALIVRGTATVLILAI